MTYEIVPRTEIFTDPVVRSSNGQHRPLLVNVPHYGIHYAGVLRQYEQPDRIVTPSLIRGIDQAARTRRIPAPNEYNYVITNAEDDLIYEYSGQFQSAGSGKDNSTTVNVLCLLGIGQPLTQRMIHKLQWLRDVYLKGKGTLRLDCVTLPHKNLPNAIPTQCCGYAILKDFAQIQETYNGGNQVKAVRPERLFDRRVTAGAAYKIPCNILGPVFVNVTVTDPTGPGWVYTGDAGGASIVNMTPGLALSSCVPIGSMEGFWLTATTDCRLIVDLFGVA